MADRIPRLHHLDALRAFAMALVVPWHAANFFAIRGESGMPVAGAIWLSHAFRMPLFFLLAGFFGAMTIGSYGNATWVRRRLVRLGIPLAVGVIALMPLAGMLDEWQYSGSESLLAALTHPRPSYLWFLWYLLIISGVALAVRGLLGRRTAAPTWIERLLRSRAPLTMLAAMAVPCALTLWLDGAWAAVPPNAFLPPAGLLAYYGIFFAFGWLLGSRVWVLEALGGSPYRRLALALVVAVPAFWLFAHSGDPGIASNPAIRLAALYLGALCCWLLIASLIGVFRRHVSAERPSVRYAADASYWIYLCHMLFLAPLQLLLVGLLPGVLQFLLAVVTTFALALITYELFVRYSAIGRVLHGPRRRVRGRGLPIGRGPLAQPSGSLTPPVAAAARRA
jgi:peptidoglycan/LPS O-acetylase OafA/YrhL